jgi:hypothetical protein
LKTAQLYSIFEGVSMAMNMYFKHIFCLKPQPFFSSKETLFSFDDIMMDNGGDYDDNDDDVEVNDDED